MTEEISKISEEEISELSEAEIIDMECEPFISANTSFKLNFLDMFSAFHRHIKLDLPARYGKIKGKFMVIAEKDDDDNFRKYSKNTVGKECLRYFLTEKLEITEKHLVVRSYFSFKKYPDRLRKIAIIGTLNGYDRAKIKIFLDYYDVLQRHQIVKKIDSITSDDTLGSLFAYLGDNDVIKSYVNSLHAKLLDNTKKADFEFLIDKLLFLLGENQEVKEDKPQPNIPVVSIKEVKDKISSLEKSMEKIEWLGGKIQTIPDSKEIKEVTRIHNGLGQYEGKISNIEGKVLALKEMLGKCRVETLSRLT